MAAAARALRRVQAARDTAVLTAYGFNAKKDLLAQLLTLNQQVAQKIKKGDGGLLQTGGGNA